MRLRNILSKATLFLLLGLYACDSASSNEIYVSKAGNDTNNGSKNAPFLTLSKAAEVATAGDVVYIDEGRYEEILSPANSGTEESPIIFQALEGKTVVIDAMQALSGWEHDEGPIFKIAVDWDLGQRNFLTHGKDILDLARWPNNIDADRFTLNSLRNEGGSQSEQKTDAYLLDKRIPNWEWSEGGSLMFYGDRPGSGWLTWRAWIKDQSDGRIDFDVVQNQNWILNNHPTSDLGDYYLEGIKEALDFENEWFFDSKEKTIYLILPNDAKPKDDAIRFAKREYCIQIKNKDYIHIKNLEAYGGSIHIEGKGNKLQNVDSKFGSMTRGISPNYYSGVQSVYIAKNAQNTSIDNCEIGQGDGTGIRDEGKHTVITNCFIHDFNTLGAYDAPLMMRGKNTKIIGNTVTRGGRDAIQIVSNGAEVAYNDFSHSNLVADDCGLLYTIGSNLEMDIHHNWFHDAKSRGRLYKAAGIYLDSSSEENPNPEKINVYNNVVWNVEWTAIQINWNGTDINIFNNTLCKAERGTMGAWHKEGTGFKNVKVWNNITDVEASDLGGNQESETTWEPQSDKQNNLIDAKAFMNYLQNDFSLKPDGAAVDAGKIIPGYTDNYVGDAPDIGAYEAGKAQWKPGVNPIYDEKE